MNKKKNVLNWTDCNKEYKVALRHSIPGNCSMCPPNQGCNQWWKYSRKSWKRYRRKQYKASEDKRKKLYYGSKHYY